MEKWITPVLDVLDVAQTQNGTAPATYESEDTGKMTINGETWSVVSTYVWESCMCRREYLSLERTY